MRILIARHWKVLSKKIYLSSIERDVTTSKIPFLLLLSRECMSEAIIGKYFYICKANTNTDKSAF